MTFTVSGAPSTVAPDGDTGSEDYEPTGRNGCPLGEVDLRDVPVGLWPWRAHREPHYCVRARTRDVATEGGRLFREILPRDTHARPRPPRSRLSRRDGWRCLRRAPLPPQRVLGDVRTNDRRGATPHCRDGLAPHENDQP